MSNANAIPTMVIVDITNLFYVAGKKWGKKLNYKTLTERFLRDHDNVKAINGYASFRKSYVPFLNILTNLGYTLKHKTIDSYLPHVSWVAQITIDVLTEGDVEKFIFLTADYGLIPLYEYLRQHNRYVEVWAPTIPLAVAQAVNDTFEFGETYCANAIAKTPKTSQDAEGGECGGLPDSKLLHVHGHSDQGGKGVPKA